MDAFKTSVSAWVGDLELGDRWALWSGVVGDGDLHRHFAAQAVIASEPVRVMDGEGTVFTGRCILIDPLVAHRLEPGSSTRLLYLEPGGALGDVADDAASFVRNAHQPVILASKQRGFWEEWLSLGHMPQSDNDPRIIKAIEQLDAVLSEGSVALTTAANWTGLSPERFRHVFVDTTGLPFRRFVLWRRLRHAAAELSSGASITEAAHSAGFSDTAHFARTLKVMFGITATQALA